MKYTQKKILEQNKEPITAVYFHKNNRILTHCNITKTQAIDGLIQMQATRKIPITLLIFNELPLLEHSWDLSDYQKYINPAAPEISEGPTLNPEDHLRSFGMDE